MAEARYRLRTEVGAVEVWLEPGADEFRKLGFSGPDAALDYVRSLVRAESGDRGRVIGDACTEGELERAMARDPLRALRTREDPGPGARASRGPGTRS